MDTDNTDDPTVPETGILQHATGIGTEAGSDAQEGNPDT